MTVVGRLVVAVAEGMVLGFAVGDIVVKGVPGGACAVGAIIGAELGPGEGIRLKPISA